MFVVVPVVELGYRETGLRLHGNIQDTWCWSHDCKGSGYQDCVGELGLLLQLLNVCEREMRRECLGSPKIMSKEEGLTVCSIGRGDSPWSPSGLSGW